MSFLFFFLRFSRGSGLLETVVCPLFSQRLTTWYQGVSASEIREERGRVMGRSLKNAVYLGN